MKDTFWTPELLAEFFNTHPDLPPTLMNEINLFKSSKAPKKEWEIAAYRFTPLNGIGGKDVIVRPGSSKWPNAPDKDYEIFSVRRLSDNSDWRVGEIAGMWDNIQRKIIGFEINEGQMIVLTDHGGYLISAIRKVPKYVFTTIDGVSIYEDGNFWHVNEDWTLSNFGISTEWIDYSKPDKDFSTREAAETYILENRPLLSLNDVKEAAGVSYDDHVYTSVLFEKLTALVKQKLNP